MRIFNSCRSLCRPPNIYHPQSRTLNVNQQCTVEVRPIAEVSPLVPCVRRKHPAAQLRSSSEAPPPPSRSSRRSSPAPARVHAARGIAPALPPSPRQRTASVGREVVANTRRSRERRAPGPRAAARAADVVVQREHRGLEKPGQVR